MSETLSDTYDMLRDEATTTAHAARSDASAVLRGLPWPGDEEESADSRAPREALVMARGLLAWSIATARLGGERGIAGRSIVVHASGNDPSATPDGAAGERIACGVIELAAASPVPPLYP